MAKESLIRVRNKLFHISYNYIVKPILFMFDPEKVHDAFTSIGELLGSNLISRKITSFLFNYRNKNLEQEILGVKFKNPVGLAAGFDKDARLTSIISEVGFGFEEIGSITGEECEGNPKPRLWRLKKSKSLIVYYGLKNEGAEKISKKLSNQKFKIPLFTSIAKTNSPETVDINKGIKDYSKAYKLMSNIGNISVINISCPNAYGGQPFHDAKTLNLLLGEIKKIPSKKPIFLKISPDLSKQEVDEILELSIKYKLSGIICSNLTKNKDNKKIIEKNIPTKGGLSGKVIQDISDDLIKYVYQKTKGKLIIIGVGGIFTAEDAYRKIKSGASLVELITGMIFNGPQTISEINQGITRLLKQDGFKNISQAIGSDLK